jgi:hypothetical protein
LNTDNSQHYGGDVVLAVEASRSPHESGPEIISEFLAVNAELSASRTLPQTRLSGTIAGFFASVPNSHSRRELRDLQARAIKYEELPFARFTIE